jgi:hypothetical protein
LDKHIYIFFKILKMSYEVYDDYKEDPSYMDFRSELDKIVKQMK